MSNDYSTWTDWADDNPEAAAIPIERTSCEHEDVDWMSLICNNCGDEMEAEEPTDAQIFAQYGQTMEYKAA